MQLESDTLGETLTRSRSAVGKWDLGSVSDTANAMIPKVSMLDSTGDDSVEVKRVHRFEIGCPVSEVTNAAEAFDV
jgi:hypothetical protein